MNVDINDLFCSFIGIITALNGFAIPLSYGTVSENLKPYLDKYSYKAFIREPEFKENYIISLIAIGVYVIGLTLDLHKSPTDQTLSQYGIAFVIVSIIIFIWFIMTFVKFSLMIYEYATNTEEVVFNKTRKEIDETLK